VSGFKQAQGHKHLKPFADGDTAHSHGLGKFILGGYAASGRPDSPQDLFAQLGEDLLFDALASYGFQSFLLILSVA
jgi:hypothetical protein